MPVLMVPLADQPGEIGFCVFTKVKRVEITLRGEPFPHLLAACGGVPQRAAHAADAPWPSDRGSGQRLGQLGGDAVVVEAARGGCSSVFVLGKATVEIPDRVEEKH